MILGYMIEIKHIKAEIPIQNYQITITRIKSLEIHKVTLESQREEPRLKQFCCHDANRLPHFDPSHQLFTLKIRISFKWKGTSKTIPIQIWAILGLGLF